VLGCATLSGSQQPLRATPCTEPLTCSTGALITAILAHSHTRANMTAEYDDRALNRPPSRGVLLADVFSKVTVQVSIECSVFRAELPAASPSSHSNLHDCCASISAMFASNRTKISKATTCPGRTRVRMARAPVAVVLRTQTFCNMLRA
jgi:hypothetical protein